MLRLLVPLLLASAPAPDTVAAVARDSAGSAPGDSAAAADSLPFRLVPGAVLAPGGEGQGSLTEPAGVAVDAFGRVVVTDRARHRLQRYDRDGSWLGESGALGSEAGEMRSPGAVAPLGAASLAVLDRENRRVLVYDLFGRLQGVRLDLADPRLESELGRIDPGELAADRGGALFVSDPSRERVLVFDGSGLFVRALGGYGARPGLFRGLRGLATTARGELVASERGNARLQRLDAGGRPAAAWALPLARKSAGALPVAVDEGGRVAVADEGDGRLWVFDASGVKLAETSGLGRPRALAFAPDGALLVAESRPARVRRFALVPSGGE